MSWYTPAGGEAEEIPLNKGAFRSALARAAVLCNQHAPDSVSPYGGEGLLRLEDGVLYHVSFVNTTAEQRIELRRAAVAPAPQTAQAETPAVA